MIAIRNRLLDSEIDQVFSVEPARALATTPLVVEVVVVLLAQADLSDLSLAYKLFKLPEADADKFSRRLQNTSRASGSVTNPGLESNHN